MLPITLQVLTNLSCNLDCTYCYEHKDNVVNDLDRIKTYLYIKFKLLKPEEDHVIVDLIGGESFLYPDLCDEIMGYSLQLAAKFHKCVWFSTTTNGTTLKNEKVRNLILKYRDRFSIGISIDGIKENHDTCRIYKDGRGSYDDAVAYLPWLLDNVDKRQLGVKATFTLDTFEKYYADSMIHIHKLGFDELAGNIVFEEIISKDKSHIIFKELKKVIDYILDNELENKVSIMQLGDLTRIRNYSPSPIEGTGEDPNRNWCGTCVHMACLGMDGKIYGCNRFCTMDKPGMELATFTNETVEIVNPELLNTVTSFKRSWKGECDTCFLKAECPTCVAAIFEAPDKDQYVAEKRQCGWTHGLVMARLYFKSKLKEREKYANAYVSQN